MKIFYIDPQSYNNLSVYDKSLLENIIHGDATQESFTIVYYHNVLYQCDRVAGVHYKGIYRYSDKRHVFKVLSYVVSTIRLCFDCLRLHPDVVHIQWFKLWHIDCLLVLLLRLLHIKTVHTAHNVLPHNPKPNDRKHYKWLYNHVDAIIVHTHRTKDELTESLNVPNQKVHVIAHGILPSTVDEESTRVRMKEISKKIDLNNRIVFSSMGFQNYYKGIDIISDVWKNNPSLNTSRQCMLLIIGKTENAQLEELHKFDNVVIVNKLVSDVDFDAYLRLSSVALLPYRQISQSGVLLTALQRHVPVLVSDVGGLTDPLNYAKVGWNIGKPSAENLGRAMHHLLENPEDVRRIRKDNNAFQIVEEAYSWKKIGEKTINVYKDIIT